MRYKTKLYDIEAIKSRFQGVFKEKINKDLIEIDSIRGTCTPLALTRLSKLAKIKLFTRDKGVNIYKIGSSGSKLKVIQRKKLIEFEIFALNQYYNLSKKGYEQLENIITYILNRKSFLIKELDLCIDSKENKEMQKCKNKRLYKTTQYYNYAESTLCIYDKHEKDKQTNVSSYAPPNIKRYELTLKIDKYNTRPNRTKATQQGKRKTSNHLNKKYNIKYKYNIKQLKKKYKKTLKKKKNLKKHKRILKALFNTS